jgi:hypothetical protein
MPQSCIENVMDTGQGEEQWLSLQPTKKNLNKWMPSSHPLFPFHALPFP